MAVRPRGTQALRQRLEGRTSVSESSGEGKEAGLGRSSERLSTLRAVLEGDTLQHSPTLRGEGLDFTLPHGPLLDTVTLKGSVNLGEVALLARQSAKAQLRTYGQ